MVKNIQDFISQANEVRVTLRRYNIEPSSWLIPMPIVAELKMSLSYGPERSLEDFRSRKDLNSKGELLGFPFQGIDFLGYPMVIINMRAMTFDEVFALFIKFNGAVTQRWSGIEQNKSNGPRCIEG